MKRARPFTLMLLLATLTILCGSMLAAQPAAQEPLDEVPAEASQTAVQTPEAEALDSGSTADQEDCAATDTVFRNPAAEVILASKHLGQDRPCPPNLTCDDDDCNTYCASLPGCVGGGCINCKCICICT